MLTQIKALLEQGQIQQALALCQEQAHALKNEPLFHLYLGAILLKLKNIDLAVQAFQHTITLDKTLVAPYKNLGLIYRAQKDPRARDFLFLASWLDPLDESLYKNLQTLEPKLPDYPEADIVLYNGTPFWEQKITPDSLLTSGLGGSETAYMMMARELSKLGKRVLCFCNTTERKVYDGITYIPAQEFFFYNHLHHTPVFVSSRLLYPFQFPLNVDKRVLWAHDIDGGIGDNIAPCFHNIDLVLALSDYQIEFLMQKMNFPRAKFLKIKNGFIPDFYSSEPETQKVPHSLIYFSRPCRGLDESLAVFKHLRTKYPDTTLHICTYTVFDDVQKDPEMMHFLSLKEEGLIRHGSLSKPELAKLLRQTEICLYPNTSHYETSCIAAMEAMAAGTPLVTSDRGALPETVQHGVGGLVVPYRQDEGFLNDLENAVIKLFENPEEWRHLSRSAQQRAWQEFRWEHVAKDWLKLF